MHFFLCTAASTGQLKAEHFIERFSFLQRVWGPEHKTVSGFRNANSSLPNIHHIQVDVDARDTPFFGLRMRFTNAMHKRRSNEAKEHAAS